jgi:hypothetical protein
LDISGTSSPDQIWQAALDEMQLQLTGATFDTWLGRARLVAYEDGTFTIGVHSQHAQEWLEHRLSGMVQRALASVCGKEVGVRFVVYGPPTAPPPAPPLQGTAGEGGVAGISIIATERADRDPPQREFVAPEMPELNEVGWFPVSRYESLFWRPLLGRVAWSVWEIIRATDIRSKDKKTDWTPVVRWTAPALAEHIGCGKQAVVGVNRTNGDGRLHRHGGAFERLSELEIGHVERQGQEPHVIYLVSVRVRLPLLTPAQIGLLPDRLQMGHDRWLSEHGFDPQDWFMATA